MRAPSVAARFLTLVWVLGVPGVPAIAAATGAESPAVDLLERAREAAQSETFAGVVVVEWYDGRQVRTAQVQVQSAQGVMRLGDEVVGTGARRFVRGPEGWLTLWGHDVVAVSPSPAVKYVLTVEPGPLVAGRPTQVIEVRLESGERARERLYVDQDSGLVLRRELLDARGRPYRSVGFSTISPSASPPLAPRHSRSQEPPPAGDVDAPYDAPPGLGAGYRLIGAYEKRGGALHLFYSDGLHGLSVFEQRGRLASMPPGGREVEVAGHTVRVYSASVGEAVVWEGDGVVYTAVSDASWADLAAAVGDLSHAERPGRLRRLAEVVVSLFRWR